MDELLCEWRFVATPEVEWIMDREGKAFSLPFGQAYTRS